MSLLLGHDTSTQQPVYLPRESRDLMLYMIGKTGTGKSTLLKRLVLADIREGYGCMVLDPHGSLIDDILSEFPRDRIEDLWLADASHEELSMGINLFACSNRNSPKDVSSAANAVVSAFKKVWGVGDDASWGPHLEDLLRNIAYTLIHNERHMTDIEELLYDEPGSKAPNLFRQRLIANVPIATVRRYWQYEYDPLSDRDQRFARSSTMNKVRAFLSNPLLSEIVGQESTLDFVKLIDGRQIVLIKLPYTGIGEDTCSLLGSVITNQFLLASGLRATREPFYLYADEYHRFATPAFAGLIDESRKNGIATTVAHQGRDQIEYQQRNVPLRAANLIVFGVTGDDADVLVGNFTIERQTEVIGQRPKLIISQDPADELVRRGHDNEYIKRLADATLAPRSRITNGFTAQSTNTYLVQMMNRWVEPGSERECELLTRTQQEREVSFDSKLVEGVKSPSDSGSMYLHLPTLKIYVKALLSQLPEDPWSSEVPSRLQPLVRRLRDTVRGVYLYYYRHPGAHSPWIERKEFQGVLPGIEEYVDRLVSGVHPQAVRLAHLGRLLREQPVYTESGQYEDIVRFRPTLDIKADLSNQLATLDPHVARIRVGSNGTAIEHMIRVVQRA